MALYLGDVKYKIGSQETRLNIYLPEHITRNEVLKSSDGFLLKDKNNLFLKVKEDE